MTLRLVLVGLVASLGLELPTQGEVESWTCSGRSWWDARLAEWDSRMPDDVRAFAVDESPPPSLAAEPLPPDQGEAPPSCVGSPEAVVADLAFAAVVDEMVEAFRADLTPPPPPAPEVTPVVVFEPLPVNDDLYDDIAHALNRRAEGLADPLPDPTAVATRTQPASVTEPRAEEPSAASTTEKLATAVRLTRQAARAWMTIIQGPATVSLRE